MQAKFPYYLVLLYAKCPYFVVLYMQGVPLTAIRGVVYSSPRLLYSDRPLQSEDPRIFDLRRNHFNKRVRFAYKTLTLWYLDPEMLSVLGMKRIADTGMLTRELCSSTRYILARILVLAGGAS